MTHSSGLLLGEVTRSLDERYRISIPNEMAQAITAGETDSVLAKERPGCLSLWQSEAWQTKLQAGVELVQSKIKAGRLEGRLNEVQLLGRLLSTRHRTVQIAGRGRLAIPDGFRDFLGVAPGEPVVVVGAAICIELWNPKRWNEYIGQQMPDFNTLFDQLTH